VTAAAHAASAGWSDETAILVDRLVVELEDMDTVAELEDVLTRLLTQAVADSWRRGWQPADLVHAVCRKRRPVHRRVCAEAVELEARAYRHASGADPAWLAQVDAVTAELRPAEADDELRSETQLFDHPHATNQPEDADQTGILDGWVEIAGGLRAALLGVVEVLGRLASLPSLPRLCPPPSEWADGPLSRLSAARAADPKMTERVRALLAKAESTPFPEEAESFTAKAQELIARHAINQAMLQEDDQPAGEVGGRRLLIDDPYGRAKSILVHHIALANRCSAVFSQELGFSTVFGTRSDLDAVELLYASLLTQATAAMRDRERTGETGPARSFRQTFLVAFAGRIGERLRKATSSAVDEAQRQHGERLLPVLASRQAAAEDAMHEAFPRTRSAGVSLNSYDGWVAGRAAADLARLGPDTELLAG
jgi:hypothetical protein